MIMVDKNELLRKDYSNKTGKKHLKGVLQQVCFTDDYVFWLESQVLELNKIINYDK